jgi:hypothetical protein
MPQSIPRAQQRKWFSKAARFRATEGGQPSGTLDTRVDPQNLPTG